MSLEQIGFQNIENQKKKIIIADVSENIESDARDIAEDKMTAEKEELRGFKGILRKIWKHNLFHEYYWQKEYHKNRNQIIGSEDLQNQMKKDAVEQFSAEYDEAIHKESGEKKELLGDTEIEIVIKSSIKNLINDFTQGKLDEDNFIEEQNRIFSQIKGARNDVFDGGISYASNLLEIAKQTKQNFEHNEGLENLDLDFEVVIGKAKGNVRTEAQFGAIDRITEKIQKSKIGIFANESTVAAAVSIAYCVGAKVSQRIANSKLASWGTFGATSLLAGGIAAARESKRLEEERRQHAREMAQGKTFDDKKDERRKEMNEFRYETKEATWLADTLEKSLYERNEDGSFKVKDISQEDLQNIALN
jgi:hypothetical protein